MAHFEKICHRIEDNDFEVLSTRQSFAHESLIEFRCTEGHVSCMSAKSFMVKTSGKSFYKLLSLCGKCNIHLNILEKLQFKAYDLGIKIVRLHEDNLYVNYLCHCGSIDRTNVKVIQKTKTMKSCRQCQNNPFKLSYQDVQKTFSDKDCVLLTPPEKYKNTEQALRYKCLSCEKRSVTVYRQIKRGPLCSCKEN